MPFIVSTPDCRVERFVSHPPERAVCGNHGYFNWAATKRLKLGIPHHLDGSIHGGVNPVNCFADWKQRDCLKHEWLDELHQVTIGTGPLAAPNDGIESPAVNAVDQSFHEIRTSPIAHRANLKRLGHGRGE